jgi:hypothetical protein
MEKTTLAALYPSIINLILWWGGARRVWGQRSTKHFVDGYEYIRIYLLQGSLIQGRQLLSVCTSDVCGG